MEEEPIRRPKTVHEIGSDLSLLSVGELKERIGALKEEIMRLEAVIRSKESSKDAATTSKVRTAFLLSKHTSPYDIKVETRQGEVFLTGQVPSEVAGKINHLLRFPAHYRFVQLLDASGSCPLCLTPPCENS